MNRPGLRTSLLLLTIILVAANLFAQNPKAPPLGAPLAPIGPKTTPPLGAPLAPIGPKTTPTSTAPNNNLLDIAVPDSTNTAPTRTQQAFAAAEALYDSGNWTNALTAFQKFQRYHSLSATVARAQYYEGWCQFKLKNYDKALTAFTSLTNNYKESIFVPEATLALAECYREMTNYTAAIQIYQDFPKKFPQSPLLTKAIFAQAEMYLQNKDIAAAKKIVQNVRATNRDPNVQLDATFMLAHIYNEDKQYDQAREIYRSIAKQSNNPRATAALFAQGETYYKIKDYPQAITFFKRVQSNSALQANINSQTNALTNQRANLHKNGDDTTAVSIQLKQLQGIAAEISKREDLRPLALFRIANCYQEMKHLDEASVVYRTILGKYPDSKTKTIEYSYCGLIQALTETKRLPEANALVEEFKAKFPTSDLLDIAGYMQAISIFGEKRYAEALERFQKFLASCKTPDIKETAEYYIAACHYAMAANDPSLYVKAHTLFTTFRTAHPTSKLLPEVLFRLGRCQYELANQPTTKPEEAKTKIAEAIRNYEEIRAKYPTFESLSHITFQLAYFYALIAAYDFDIKTGALSTTANYDKAITTFELFIHDWPDQTNDDGQPLAAEVYYQIAHCQLAAKRFEKAIDAFQKLLTSYAESPLAPIAAYETSDAYAKLKQNDKAIATLHTYINKYPKHAKVADALFLIADNLNATKKTEEAITTFASIIERTATDEKNRETWIPIAIAALQRIITIQTQRGDIKAALAACDDTLAKFPKNPVVIQRVLPEIVTIYRRAKLPEEGLAKFNLIAQQNASSSILRIAALTSLLDLAIASKNYTNATEAANRLLNDPEKNKLPAPTYIALGNLFLKTEKPAQARDAFQKVITLYPSDTTSINIAQLGLGQSLLALKDFAGAETVFNTQMPKDPLEALPEVLLGMAQVYEEKARGKNSRDPLNVKAVEYYTRVAKCERRDLMNESYYHLGNFFFNANEKKAALQYFMHLLFATEPFLEESMFHSAACHEALNNMPQALKAYRNYKGRYPTGKYISQVDQKITELTQKIKSK